MMLKDTELPNIINVNRKTILDLYLSHLRDHFSQNRIGSSLFKDCQKKMYFPRLQEIATSVLSNIEHQIDTILCFKAFYVN